LVNEIPKKKDDRDVKNNRRQRIQILLKVSVSLMACVILLWLVDWQEINHVLGRADLYWIVFVFILIHLHRWWRAYKWNLLLNGSGARLSHFLTLQAYYVGAFWTCFLPSVGGDVVRGVWLIERVGTRATITSSIVIERVLGFLVLAIMATGSIILGTLYFGINSIQLSMGIVLLLLGSSVGVALLFNEKMLCLAGKMVESLPFPNLPRLIEKFRVAILSFKKNAFVLRTFFILSILEQGFPIIAIYLLTKAFEIELPVAWALIGVPIILAISKIPISIDGLGLTEAGFVFVFALAGIPINESLIVAISGRILMMASALPGVFLSGLSGFASGSSLRKGESVSSDPEYKYRTP